MKEPMKMKDLTAYGIPSYILNIWERYYSPYLLQAQEDAVRNFGILDYNDKNKNLLVITPTSSGKTFIGEMAAITQIIHQQKTIYLVPLKSLAQEKYKNFKNLYSKCELEIVTSSRYHREDDDKIIKGDYNIAVIVYEKFHYFLFKYPDFLAEVSLIIVDELQMINDPGRGPLLESMIDHLKIKEKNPRIIALSTPLENQEAVLKWFSAKALLSHYRPIELRKGIVRKGTFKYINHNERTTIGQEVFFKKDAVRDNCFEDYLLETIRYCAKHNEPTLIFFPTCVETRRCSKWLVSQLESPAAPSVMKELRRMEETLSRNELLELLKRGMAYHNADLSWEERNLIEKYLKEGEIKAICATTTLALGVELPFKNVIIASNKMYGNDRDYHHACPRILTLADVENIGGRAGRLNRGKKGDSLKREEDFGRVIFLAPSLISETIFQKLYFNSTNQVIKKPVKKEKDLLTFLLRLIVNYNQDSREKIRQYLKKVRASSQSSPEEENNTSSYWQFHFEEEDNIEQEIDKYLDILVENKLIRKNKKGNFSPTTCGILVITKAIKVETYLYFKSWIKESKKGEISNLEILLFLSLSPDGKELSIPFSLSCINDCKRERHNCGQEETYRCKILRLVYNQGEEDKKLYQDKLILKKDEGKVFTLENYLAFKKTLLLYDWIGSKKVKSIEEEYSLYGGSIKYLAEGFSWLAESLANLAEIADWKEEREEDLKKIRLISEQLIKRVEEEGLGLARLPTETCKSPKPETCSLPPEPILQIDKHRPDRIIFLGKEVKLTSIAFSLVYLLAQNLGKVLSYNSLLDTLWKDEEDAIYSRINYHISKIRSTILKTIGESRINKEKVKDIFVVVHGRGIMLKLKSKELKINLQFAHATTF